MSGWNADGTMNADATMAAPLPVRPGWLSRKPDG
jgi:hypothetical protein